MLNVLIVDDESLIRLGIRTSFMPWTEQIRVVGDKSNGVQALEFIRKNPELVDCVLTDIKMPVMNGLELTREIKRNYPEIKVIILSSYNEIAFVKEAMLNGASDYLLKHEIDENNIIDKLENVFGKIRAESNASSVDDNEGASRNDMVQKALEGEYCEPLFDKDAQKIVFVLEVVNAQKIIDLVYGSDGGRMLDLAIMNILSEYLSGQSDVEIIVEQSGRYTVVYQIKKGELYMNTVEFCGMLLKKYLNVVVRIGVSDVFRMTGDMKGAYEQAQEAIQGGFFAQPNQSYYADYRLTRNEDIEAVLNQNISDLKRILKEQDYISLQEFFSYMESMISSHRGADTMKIRKAYLIMAELLYNELVLQDRSLPQSLQRLKGRLLAAEALFQITAIMQQLSEALNLLTEAGSENVSSIIKKSICYIEKNYGDDELSLSKVSGHLHLNAAYFSRLFKKEMGIGFVDYLTKVRIDKAISLIMDDYERSFQEVSLLVGYANYNHFSKTFKKVTGKSPSEYR